jgi:hypothetical protein
MDGNGHNPTQVAAVGISITITLDPTTGQVGVSGTAGITPIFCYGLLEMGRQAIQQFSEQQAKGARIVAASTLPQVVRNH